MALTPGSHSIKIDYFQVLPAPVRTIVLVHPYSSALARNVATARRGVFLPSSLWSAEAMPAQADVQMVCVAVVQATGLAGIVLNVAYSGSLIVAVPSSWFRCEPFSFSA